MIVKCSMRQCSLTSMQAHTVACWGLFSNRFTLELNLKIIYEFYNFARAGFENPICNFHTCDLFI